MKTPAERRRSAPSLILDRALQKRPSTKESPSDSVDTCIFLSSFMCSNRILLIDGQVELKRGLQRQERYLFLFNDLFVVTKIKDVFQGTPITRGLTKVLGLEMKKAFKKERLSSF